MLEINEVAVRVLSGLRELGYAPTTVASHKRALATIVKWFNDEAGGEFTDENMERCLKHLESQFDSGSICKQWYNIKVRLLERMRLCAAGESVRGDYRKCSHRKYEPSKAACTLVDAVLAKKHTLTKDFKRKLSGVMRRFLCYIESLLLPLDSISRSIMIDYVRTCAGYSRGQMQYVARGLTELAKYLVANGLMDRVPDFMFIIPRTPTHRLIPAFAPQEVAAILNAIDRNTSVGSRNYAIILLAVSTGLRVGDIIKMKLQDIDWKNGIISLVQSKTQKPHTVTISGQVRNAISEYILNHRPKSDSRNIFLRTRAPYTPLSATLTSMFNRTEAKAEVEKKPWRAIHSLRRSFGTWLAKERVPITTISQLLGHVDMTADRAYLSFDDVQLTECAMGFADIPLTRRIFDDVCRTA